MGKESEEEAWRECPHCGRAKKARGVTTSHRYPITAQVSGGCGVLGGSASMGRHEVITKVTQSLTFQPCVHPSLSYSNLHTQTQLSHRTTHTLTHKSNEHDVYLEVGSLCLVHSEPHEYSELEVIGERISVREKESPLQTSSAKTSQKTQEIEGLIDPQFLL